MPAIGPDEVLVAVMAAGINYNNVWAAQGIPIDVIATAPARAGDGPDFHVGGSDASGIVYAVGEDVGECRGRRRGDHPPRVVGSRRSVGAARARIR